VERTTESTASGRGTRPGTRRAPRTGAGSGLDGLAPFRPSTPAPPPAPPGPARRRTGTVMSVCGEVLLTLGLVICLYLVYELWWSNLTAAAETRHNSSTLLQRWQSDPAAGSPGGAIPAGTGFAFLYIPALGPDWRALIMQGTDRTTVLNTGAVGHYTDPDSAMPWDPAGNFAVAGHRDGHGMIFRDLNELQTGEKVYVQTQYGWFTYQLDREAPSVDINDIDAVDPIPQGSGYTGPGRYITMTTCTPMYIDSQRMIWWGHLISQSPAAQTPPGVTPAT
jgi:sortase A